MSPWDDRVVQAHEHGRQYCSLWMTHDSARVAAVWLVDVGTGTSRFRVGKLGSPHTGRSWYCIELP